MNFSFSSFRSYWNKNIIEWQSVRLFIKIQLSAPYFCCFLNLSRKNFLNTMHCTYTLVQYCCVCINSCPSFLRRHSNASLASTSSWPSRFFAGWCSVACSGLEQKHVLFLISGRGAKILTGFFFSRHYFPPAAAWCFLLYSRWSIELNKVKLLWVDSEFRTTWKDLVMQQ